jgi:hypothetical protein
MKFTFGIITGGGAEQRINEIVNSIESQNIDDYEIVVVGNCNLQRSKMRVIPFDENMKRMWITRKKNIVTYDASFENIVYLHDYIKLGQDWYEGFKKFGEDFKICMTKMIQVDGQRFRDWTLWAGDASKLGLDSHDCLLPYDIIHLSKYMYISGAYWIAKKEVMLEFPLDESLSWGQSEDVLWSEKVRQKYNFSINSNSSVILMKLKDRVFKLIKDEDIERIKKCQ